MLAFGMPAGFTRDQIAAIAALAHLDLDAAEIDLFARQLGEIFEYAEVVQQLDTTGVQPTSSVAGAHLSDRAPTYHSVTEHEHFHLVCRNCHKVISVDPDVLTPVTERLAADHGFTIDVGHLTVFGICGDHS